MNKGTIAALLVAVLVIGAVPYAWTTQEVKPPVDPTIAVLMKKKLEYSQQLLESLTLNDLPAAGKQAEALLRIRREAGFRVLKTPEYEHWADSFTTAGEGIIKASKDNNLESAKLHYLGLTMACFNCHSYTRDLRKRG